MWSQRYGHSVNLESGVYTNAHNMESFNTLQQQINFQRRGRQKYLKSWAINKNHHSKTFYIHVLYFYNRPCLLKVFGTQKKRSIIK